ncbi:MAG: response regulator [Gammaproteobacteria bacterium]|nr:MAG: response regulator [Gammaproteobacteria bacterium]
MTTKVLICDDSTVAQKQMTKTLPTDWDAEITLVKNGMECLDALKAGKGDLVFLDLNMPVMDGYEVLAATSELDLASIIIVVSGDIQPEAHDRVKRLGAVAFIKKPVIADEVTQILVDYGVYRPADNIDGTTTSEQALISTADTSDLLDCIQEISNVAMGQAADLLARLLDVFVKLPIPKVNFLEVAELEMALSFSEQEDTFSAVCQGFIGSGIAGEALVIFSDSSFTDMARLLKYQGEITHTVELELLMDIASILVGACTNGIAQQLDIAFSLGHPIVIGQHVKVEDLVKGGSNRWKKTLAIEISYKIESCNIACDLLLLLTEDSVDNLKKRLSFLI